MKRLRSHSHRLISATLFAGALLSASGAALAQERGGLLDNLFSRGEQQQQQSQVVQGDANELGARINRIENALRQLTGTVEELQHQNRQLQMQLQQMGAPGANAAAAGSPNAPLRNAPAPGPRGDVFNPAANPNAPGAPRPLAGGGMAAPGAMNATGIGAPDGRDAGAPLDLGSLAAAAARQDGQLPPPPPRNTSATGAQLATLPPSATPKDQYDLAYGYVLHKDYGLAEQAFQDFLKKYPDEAAVPDAQYWLGESQFQQQRYRDAAESFLAVSTKHERSGKAPEALLRLGQSLAAMEQKEAACATLAEVGRKYPRASANVKRNVAQEQKRVSC